MNDFGKKLEEYRERLGMKQSTLAERAELDPSYLNRIEKGTRKPPGVEKVLRMIEVLRLTRKEAEDLVELAGYSPLVLQTGSLSYSAPTVDEPGNLHADLRKLHATLAKLPPYSQQTWVDALTALIETVATADLQTSSRE